MPVEHSTGRPSRILVIGKSGSGKSTLAKKLSKLMNVEHIEMDTLFWNPGWVKTPPDQMRAKVDARVRRDKEWVVDGNYRPYADITWQRADLIIWLDFSILLVLWRLICRSVWRIWTKQKVCGENYESGAALFWPTIEYNILLCCIRERRKHAEDYPKFIKEYGQGKLLRFTSQRDVDEWFEQMGAEHKKRYEDRGEVKVWFENGEGP